MRQTARDETQVPVRRSHFDEEEYQGHEEDIANIFSEDRQHMCKVVRAFESNGRGTKCWKCIHIKLTGEDGAARRKVRNRKEVSQEDGMVK